VKSFVRRWVYRLVYLPVRHAFYIGKLNEQHLRQCGMPEQRLSRSPYCAPDPLASLSERTKHELRRTVRARCGISPETCVLCFSGKLIVKKDPGMLFAAIKHLSAPDRNRFHVLVLGCGELMPHLISEARSIPVPATFAGFVNQDELATYYLAADVLVLPSRRMGETWGLVVNEALHAGCAVTLSDAVGCAPEFAHLERCRIFPAMDDRACARAILELSRLPRSFTWAASAMKAYSVAAAAKAIADKLP
jgi:glycosyltransferase involved in cell wall biosynthesis